MAERWEEDLNVLGEQISKGLDVMERLKSLSVPLLRIWNTEMYVAEESTIVEGQKISRQPVPGATSDELDALSQAGSLQKVSDLILGVVKEDPHILKAPAPLVFFEEFGENALIFRVYMWLLLETEKDNRVTCSNIRHRVKEALDKAGIVAKYPLPVKVVRHGLSEGIVAPGLYPCPTQVHPEPKPFTERRCLKEKTGYP